MLSSHDLQVEEIVAYKPEALVISPGPCTPKEAGVSVACVQHFRGTIPVLGVCLGHQVIVELRPNRPPFLDKRILALGISLYPIQPLAA